MTIMTIMMLTVMMKMFMIVLVGGTILRLKRDGALMRAIGAMRSNGALVGLLFETG